MCCRVTCAVRLKAYFTKPSKSKSLAQELNNRAQAYPPQWRVNTPEVPSICPEWPHVLPLSLISRPNPYHSSAHLSTNDGLSSITLKVSVEIILLPFTPCSRASRNFIKSTAVAIHPPCASASSMVHLPYCGGTLPPSGKMDLTSLGY